MSKKYTIEEINNLLKKRNIIFLDEQYFGNHVKHNFKCLVCGYCWPAQFSNVNCYGSGCSVCSKRKKYTVEEVLDFCLSKEIKVLSKEYKNNKQLLDFQCSVCFNLWKEKFCHIKNRNYGCPKCGYSIKRKQTYLKKYGVDHPLKNRDILLKSISSRSKSIILYHWETGMEIVCTGSYERKVVEWLNLNRKRYDWQSQIFTMPDGRTYRPDLYLIEENIWVEIKGYFYKDAQEKWNWFHSVYPNSELWDKEALKIKNILV